MTFQIKVRLGVMMFLEYFIWGAWYVTIGTWLSTRLHFSGQQVGIVAGATAIGAMLAPFLVGIMADKLFATEKVLGVLHLVGGALLFLASRQTGFVALYSVIMPYCLCYMPTMALTNSLAFRHMRDPKLEFGSIRVLGTSGWIVAGLLVGSLGLEATSHPLQIAAFSSVVMGLYCFTLPHTPPLARVNGQVASGSILPKGLLSLLKERSMAVFAIASFLICIPLQFYYAFTNLFLNQSSVANAAGKMSAGQFSELLCMLLIPWFFRRLGVKYMLAAGMLAWVVRYVLFAYGDAGSGMWMLWLGILLHGICYDFFFVTGQIYIDHKAPAALRAAAQGLISLITYGVGMFVGSWLSGAVVEYFAGATVGGQVLYRWRPIWLFSAMASAFVLMGFLLTFRDTDIAMRQSAASEAMQEAPL
jgi:nucleoside transporter